MPANSSKQPSVTQYFQVIPSNAVQTSGKAEVSRESTPSPVFEVEDLEDLPKDMLQLESLYNTFALKPEVNFKECCRMFKQAWNIVRVQKRSKVTPLYVSPIIKEFVEKINGWIIHAKRFKAEVEKEYRTAGSILVTGVMGVGKTTLMYGSSKVLPQLESSFLSIYHNYKSDTTVAHLPHRLVMNELRRMAFLSEEVLNDLEAKDFGNPFFESLEEAYDNKGGAHCFIAFYADEVEHLYKLSNIDLGRKIMRQIEVIGEAPNHFAVVSGSGASTRALVTREEESGLALSTNGFPTLNRTKFKQIHVHPLRKVKELDFLVKTRFSSMSSTNITELFGSTGGIGRHIDDFCKGDYSVDTNRLIKEMASDNTLLKVVGRLFLTNDILVEVYNPWKLIGQPQSEIRELMDNQTLLDRYIDAGYIYRDKRSVIHFLIPQHFIELRQYFQSADSSGHLWYRIALLGTTEQWKGCGSAGGVIEYYFLCAYFQSLGHGALKHSLTFAQSKPEAPEFKTALTQLRDVKLDDINAISSLPLNLKADKGLDGLIIEKITDLRYQLIGIQVKSGGKNVLIKASGKDDGSLATIEKKAIRQFNVVISEIRKAHPEVVEIIPTQFHLITNKKAEGVNSFQSKMTQLTDRWPGIECKVVHGISVINMSNTYWSIRD